MTARLVTLHDGATAPSDSEAWRHECEARAIAALPTLAARRAWLAAIAKRRGDPAADRLRATIAAIWAQRTPQERWATTHVGGSQ